MKTAESWVMIHRGMADLDRTKAIHSPVILTKTSHYTLCVSTSTHTHTLFGIYIITNRMNKMMKY